MVQGTAGNKNHTIRLTVIEFLTQNNQIRIEKECFTVGEFFQNEYSKRSVVITIILVPFFRVDGSKQNSFSKTCHHVEIVWIGSEINIVGNWFL
jgi:hypothetical protein